MRQGDDNLKMGDNHNQLQRPDYTTQDEYYPTANNTQSKVRTTITLTQEIMISCMNTAVAAVTSRKLVMRSLYLKIM